jgi:hypothetical protein
VETRAAQTEPSRARAGDGVCTALAKTRGRRCQAPAVLGNVCWCHGGAALSPPWTLTTTGAELAAYPAQAQTAHRRRARPIQGKAAVELTRRGVITKALFFAGIGRYRRILRRIERAGVKVISEGGGLVARYRFEVGA